MDNQPTERWKLIDAMLDQILDLPPEDRTAFLDQVKREHPTLHDPVRDLLQAGHEADILFNNPQGNEVFDLLNDFHHARRRRQSQAASDDWKDRRVGQYRIIRSIGRGGMGQVFLARRDDETFKKYVALKVIRRGMDTEDILRRFRIERQILAALDHPHIARLLDGGATDDGLSYLVMEYIEGTIITRYCDEYHLSVDQRLRLFQDVCAAVHYAHQNLIVHRDLKPSNILVTSEGTVKLLDFGIAKFLNPDLVGFTVPMTRTELRVMTPEYASPEQVRGLTITTASDIYALGVLLYELLTGHRPYQVDSRAQTDLERIICETEPERPSSAIRRTEQHLSADGTTTVTPETVSKARSTQVERLKRRLAGDLDTMVLMAMRKEPERRYRSAEAFLVDINRHLAGLPVNAQRATMGYRTRKFIRRHRVGVAVAAMLSVLLLLVAALSVRFAVVTQAQSQRLEQVKDFLIGMFEGVDPDNARGEEVTAREMLDRGKEEIETLSDQPEVQAEMLHVMGVVYRQLGLFKEARPLLERSVAMRRSLYGETHADVAQSLAALASLLEEVGEYEEAEDLYRAALTTRQKLFGAKHPLVATILNDLAIVEAQTGNYDEAERLCRQALAMQRELHGEEHEDIIDPLQNLAVVLTEKGNYDEAEQLYREALDMQRKLLGHDHPDVGTNLVNLGSLLYDKGAYDEAEALLRESLTLRLKLLDEEHPLVAMSKSWLGRVLHKKGAYTDAERLYRDVLAFNLQQFGERHPRVARDLHFLARLHYDKGNPAGVEQRFQRALAIYDETLPKDHPYPAQTKLELGRFYLDQQQPEQALPLLRDALRIWTAVFGEADQRAAEGQRALGLCLTALARYDEAEPLLLASHTTLQSGPAYLDDQRQQARQALFDLYTAWGKPDQAAAYRD